MQINELLVDTNQIILKIAFVTKAMKQAIILRKHNKYFLE